MDKFENMRKVISNRFPQAKQIEILFCKKQKKEKRYIVTVVIDGEMDIQIINKGELE